MKQSNFKIICIAQIYNELEKGNLERFIKYVLPLVDELIVYDDGSTDGSYEYIKKFTKNIIKGKRNEFHRELFHKELLLKKALKFKPDFIFYLDADEVFSKGGREKLEEVCDWMIKEDLDGASFHKINLWRSKSWQRIDSLFDIGWFVHLWRVKHGMSYGVIKEGLHQNPCPKTVRKIKRNHELAILHFGFSDIKNIAYKYMTYKNHDQRGYNDLDRLIDEQKLKLKKVDWKLFPSGLYTDDSRPERINYSDFIIEIMKYRENPSAPTISIVCLIYKSTDWLKFSYSQIVKYSDLRNTEIYYIANDADRKVLKFLKRNKVPFYEWNNSRKQKKEWYIDNVYRAWNFAAEKAKGEFIVFVNSDMAYTYEWIENLRKWYNGRNCVASRLVESGKLKSGEFGIEKNFGKKLNEYKEGRFQEYASVISTKTAKKGGLFMPLLIKKNDFLSVKGYPEGNALVGSDIFYPKIAKQGDVCVSGDAILIKKLKFKGIEHITSFDSIVYHFQQGEMDEDRSDTMHSRLIEIARKIKHKIS